MDELRQVLGTCTEIPKAKKHANDAGTREESDKKDSKCDAPDELVYRDSSTFLKVRFIQICVKL